jgi:ribosomal protein S18 acetylase RimI-like enzyme
MSAAIRLLRAGDEAVLSRIRADVFDHAIDARAARTFLADPRHHLAVALDAGEVVGFASAVHYVHPDRAAPELWINEVGVAPSHQRQGLGRLLLRALFDVARELGCTEAWVATEHTNTAATGLYEALGGEPEDAVVYGFRL